MHQTFDKSVPVSTQRYLVAIKQCIRKRGKRHRTGKRKSLKFQAKQAKGAIVKAKQIKQRMRFWKAATAYWSGESDIHPRLPGTADRARGDL